MSRVIRRGGFLPSIAIIIFSATKVLAGSAAMTSAQLALYQGADREKVLIEGAKREGQLTLYTSHTWFRTLVKTSRRNIRLSKLPSGATTRRTSSEKYSRKQKPAASLSTSWKPPLMAWAS